MVFFLCSACSVSVVALQPKKAAKQGGSWEWSSEGNRASPLWKQTVEGDERTDAEGSAAEKHLKTESDYYPLTPRQRAKLAWLMATA
jgi:hypothetical protein